MFYFFLILNMKTSAILLFTMIILTHGKGGGYGSSRSRGSNAKGYGYGANSKSRNTRGPTHNEGYRRNYYAVYASLFLFNTQSRTYLHNKDKKTLESEPKFDCGNGIHITEDKVCDWIDDCGNGVDERVPLPCKGIYSKNELYLYITLIIIYLLWILVIKIELYFYKKKVINSDNSSNTQSYIRKKEEEMEYIGKMISTALLPGIMLFITFVFLCTAVVNEKSVIIEYYITTCVFIALNIVIACSIVRSCLTFIIWLLLFIIVLTTLFIGSIQFSHIPKNLPINITNYKIYSNNSDMRNLTLENTFWIAKENESASFIIEFNETIDLKMLMIYPTYPYKTTNRFKIYNSLNKENWTALISGPMPLVENRTGIETSFSEVQHTNMKYLKFIGEPNYECNMTIDNCINNPGLDYFEFYGVIP